MLRYFGVLSSHSSLLRSQVVPDPAADGTAICPPKAQGDQLALFASDDNTEPPRRKRWAWLLRHVFQIDTDTCPRCGGAMRWLEAATTAEAAARLLVRLGLEPQPLRCGATWAGQN